MHTFDMINFQKLFKLDDKNKVKGSLYENLSNDEKRVLYDETTNQNKKSINLKSNKLYYSIFAIVQLLFSVSIILSSVIGLKYRGSMTGYKLLFHDLSMLLALITVIEILGLFCVYFGDTESIKNDMDFLILFISIFSSIFFNIFND